MPATRRTHFKPVLWWSACSRFRADHHPEAVVMGFDRFTKIEKVSEINNQFQASKTKLRIVLFHFHYGLIEKDWQNRQEQAAHSLSRSSPRISRVSKFQYEITCHRFTAKCKQKVTDKQNRRSQREGLTQHWAAKGGQMETKGTSYKKVESRFIKVRKRSELLSLAFARSLLSWLKKRF